MENSIRQTKRLRIAISSFLLVIILLAMFFLQSGKLQLAMPLLVLPFIILMIVIFFIHPPYTLIATLCANYFAMGIARYLPGPLGLSVDGLLTLTWLGVVFSQFNKKVHWHKAWNGLTFVALIWFGYTLFQLFNPEAISQVAWFYAMRGVSFYMVLTVPLVFLIFNQKKDLDLMLTLWAWFTLAGVGKGLMQQVIGPDPWEQHWLAVIGGKTHLLPGGLRVFSFFTDAATYGGAMGFSGVVFGIIAINTEARKKKFFYLIVSGAAFIGMIISGTRGAIAVPFAGLAMYAVISKRMKILFLGFFALLSVFVFLKFTTIGNSLYEIRRFRTGLSADNPSLLVRKENQKLLKTYLRSRPFGGGLGSAGNWGLRFSPGTFLAETPTDSWYVQIWAEQGIVGLTLHLLILIYILSYGSFVIMFQIQSPEIKGKMSALLSGMFGIMVASYGSGALGQMPNGIIIYMSMSFIFLSKQWDKEEQLRKTIERSESSH